MTQPNASQPLTAIQVTEIHKRADTDFQPSSAHHTLGPSPLQASPGNHTHNGRDSKVIFTAPTVTGSRGGNAALTSLLTALASQGIITNNTSV